MSVAVAGAAEAAEDASGFVALRLNERWSLGTRIGVSMAALALLAIAVMWQTLFPERQAAADIAATAAAALVAVPVLAAAVQSVRAPSLHGITDQLVAVSLVAAWATGDMMTAAILPIVMNIGHVLEERSLLGSREAIHALGRLVKTTSRRVLPSGGVEEVPTQQVVVGDLLELKPGDAVPADGTVRSGSSSLDVASLTGESVPLDVAEGDPVLAGSINIDGRLVVSVTRIGADTTLGSIIGLMRTAEQSKPPITRVLEKYAGRYTTMILLIAAGVWFVTGNSAAMLAVLVSSCPCALILAAPATAVAAIVVAARHGILIKGSAFLEQLAEVNSVVFDKTGTLTVGELEVVALRPAEGVADADLVAISAALAAASSHPVSRAIARLCPFDQLSAVEDVREARGFGVTAHHKGEMIALGRPELFAGLANAAAPPEHDGPIAGVSRGGTFLGWLLLADQTRPEAEAATRDLRDLGLGRQILLTGDRMRVAERIAGQLGIADVCAEALPQRKMARVLEEIELGFRPMVVGDGINDSLALKAGAVGVAMGARGTDVALASADLVLMTSDLRRLGTCVRLSRRCRRTIHVNIAMGLGWTALLIALAASGLLGAQGAVVAAVFHNLSTFAGMANAGRLLYFDETGSRTPASPER
jgi:Cd2+/Zn2+-exporting ATPase